MIPVTGPVRIQDGSSLPPLSISSRVRVPKCSLTQRELPCILVPIQPEADLGLADAFRENHYHM